MKLFGIALILGTVIASVFGQTASSCVGVKDGGYISDGACGWIQCANNVEYARGVCAEGLAFDEKTGTCTYPSEECREWWTSTAAPTTTVPPVDLSMYECPADVDLIYVAHPRVCSLYALCYLGKISRQYECFGDGHFDADAQTCISAADSTCVDNPCPLVDTEDPTYLASDTDCSRYYICVNGSPRPFSCAPGLYFDLNTQLCVDSSLVTCEVIPPTVTEPSAPEVPEEPENTDA